MDLAEQRDARRRAAERAHRDRQRHQQYARRAEQQVQQAEAGDQRNAADQAGFLARLALAVGGIQQPARGQQLALAGVGAVSQFSHQALYLQGQAVVESIAMGACVDHGPALPLVLGSQMSIQPGLDIARLQQLPLRQIGDAEPVMLHRHQRVALEGVVQALQALLDEGLRPGDQGLATGCVEERKAMLEQLPAQRGQVGIDGAPNLGEQAAGLQRVGDFAGQCVGLDVIGMAYQQHQVAIQRLLHACFGQLLQLARRAAGQQLQQIGADRRAVAPLPGGEPHQAQQGKEKQRGNPAG